ncbi:MAG: glycosyltransferase family 2 protein [Eubacteriales bacterium]|nr:glycosyltransferase family 2 protein [Eubacteriales bacterium]
MKIVSDINSFIYLMLTVLYFYQAFYVIVALVNERKKQAPEEEAKTLHKYAFIIAARNENAVIGNLIDSIKNQNYPKELIDVIVVADNCTDNTAEISRQHGAIVYERFDSVKVGKGYALDYVFNKLAEENGDYTFYDGYFVFDADNIIDVNYVREMNKVFDNGYKVVTSYRNSKNYDTNWITAGYSLWFLREAKYLNNPRMILKTSCAVSGTGYLVDSSIIKQNNGWKCNLLTEDIEFSVTNILEGEKIGYCGNAVFYDEQPTTFRQSWNQRMRWTKGFYQVLFKYGKDLIKAMFKQKRMFVSCYDMLMTLAPATLFTLGLMLFNVIMLICSATNPVLFKQMIGSALTAVCLGLVNFYFMLFFVGLITLISEWKMILAPGRKKIMYLFSFPLFIATYIPISIVALFKKVEWKPIPHTVVKTMDELSLQQYKN